MSRDIVSEGQVVYDRAEDGEHRTPLVVTDPTPGTVGDQDAKTRKLIRDADDNAGYDTSDDANCVTVAYLDESMSSRTYTFPESRLKTPEFNKQTLGYPPAVWAKARMLVRLYETTDLEQQDVLEASVEGQVILCADDLLAATMATK